ncbi:hypothetical protein, partial [Microcoleus sp. B4-C3]
ARPFWTGGTPIPQTCGSYLILIPKLTQIGLAPCPLYNNSGAIGNDIKRSGGGGLGIKNSEQADRTENLLACGRSTFPEKSLISNQ